MSFIKIGSKLKTLQKNDLFKLTKKVLDTNNSAYVDSFFS